MVARPAGHHGASSPRCSFAPRRRLDDEMAAQRLAARPYVRSVHGVKIGVHVRIRWTMQHGKYLEGG